MYFVLVVIANSNIFSVFLATEVEAREELQCSADAICQVYIDTDLELQEALNDGPPYSCINISVNFNGTWQKQGFTCLTGRVYMPDRAGHRLPCTAMRVKWTPRDFLMWNSLSGKQHMLLTVASTTTSPVKPWSKRQRKLCGATPSPNTMCGMLTCSVMATLLHTRQSARSSHMGNIR